jgi:flagellar motor switch protein FliN/FliY
MTEGISQRDALTRLGASTAEAIARVLEMFAPDQIERGEVSVLPDTATAFTSLPQHGVAASVSYVDGVTGANVFVMTPRGAQALAAAMMGGPPPDPAPEDAPIVLSDLEVSAVSEAANQMMAAASAAIGVMLGQEIQISPPDTRVIDDPAKVAESFGTAPHCTSTTFMIAGEACRLIQLVPSAFVVRMARAIDELTMDGGVASGDGAAGAAGADAADEPVGLKDALSGVHLRVWAELGRTRLPIGDAIELPPGAVVDLDRPAEAPVDLFVNGLRFAQGHLLVTDDGEWAVRIESVGSPVPPSSPVPAISTQPQGAIN